jgi:hypothetical protein
MSVLLTDMQKSVVFLAILESCTLSQANRPNVGYTRKTHGIQCVCPCLDYPWYQHCPFSATKNWIAMQGDTVPPPKQGMERWVIFRLTSCQWVPEPKRTRRLRNATQGYSGSQPRRRICLGFLGVIRPKQPIAPQNSCSACRWLISSALG